MDWKELRLVATINSLPHFDWKHAVLGLTPEYQVYSVASHYCPPLNLYFEKLLTRYLSSFVS